ncbi:hypothetical protein K438DRAFT_260296 [Mycena galopus ATCC 62051]|nr:hypothetical protein K438DRAFT_260296 [Mycena galopus ATCC 62051]
MSVVYGAYFLVLETLNTGFDMQMMYQPLILQYGQVLDYIFFSPRRVLAIVARLAPHPRPPTAAQPLCVVLVSTPALLRVAHLDPHPRPHRARPHRTLRGFAGGLWTATKLALITQFARKSELHAPALLWFSASSAADVGITVGLVWTLTHRKTGFVATDSVIDKNIRTTIQTGRNLDLQRAGHHLLHGLPAPRVKFRLGPPPLQALLQRAALDAQCARGAREHVGLTRAVWVGRALRAARHAHGDAHGAARV